MGPIIHEIKSHAAINIHHNTAIKKMAIYRVHQKNNPLEKMLYFSHCSMDLSHTFRLYVSIHARYPAIFIEITDIVPQIQQFKL